MASTQEPKYAATYHLGNTVVHVIAPPPMAETEKEKILHEFYHHAWNVWNSLPVEERLRINAKYE